jgi:hypothetical protein
MITTTISSPSNSSKNKCMLTIKKNIHVLTQTKIYINVMYALHVVTIVLFCMLIRLTNNYSHVIMINVVVLNKYIIINILRIFHVLKFIIRILFIVMSTLSEYIF